MPTPWRKLREKPLHTGWRTVVSRTFSLPDGREVDFEVSKGNDIAWILALTEDEEVILVRQYRPGPEEFMLEVPAGAIETGENPLEAAARELLEETGYTGSMTLLSENWSGAYNTARSFHFLATGCRKVADPDPDENEFIETVLVPLSQLREDLTSGKVSSTTAWLALEKLGKTHGDSLRGLTAAVRGFSRERDWDQFHNPKNLAMALMVEAGELGEIFQWMPPAEAENPEPAKLKHAAEEIGDVLLYVVNLASRLGIDPVAAAHDKLREAARKYPADQVRGSSKKYTEYKEAWRKG